MDVPFFRVGLPDSAVEAVGKVMREGWLTTGPSTQEFQRQFAERIGAPHALGLTSCTAALHLALEAIGIEEDDLVIVPTMTFAATAEVVCYFKAVPVFVDCGDDFNIDPAALEATIEAIEANQPVAGMDPPYGPLKAIIPMHYGGYMCEMDRILAIARKHDLPVVEDAAHTFPAAYRPAESDPWQHAGTMGDYGCFSFYANKCITTGEGGMVVCHDDDAMARMRLMALHGMNRDAWRRYTSSGSWFYEIVAPGFKYNMTDIAASIGLDELTRTEQYLERRTAIARAYDERLRELDIVELPPRDETTRQHSWHLYSIRLNLDRLTVDRAQFIDAMRDRGIRCSVHWLPLHMMPYYKETFGYREGLYPMAESIWPRQVSLPIFPQQTDAEVDAVCTAVEQIADERHA